MMMNTEQVVARLKHVQGRRSLRWFARDLGVSAPYLCEVYSGKRPPGPKILDVMSLKKQVVTSTLYIPK